MARYNDFEELPIWKEARALSKEIYALANRDSFRSNRGLRVQLQRTIVSVGSNIAEGFDRSTDKDFVHFLNIAKASIAEVRAQLYFAMDINNISESDQRSANQKLKQLANQIGGFIQYLCRTPKTRIVTTSEEP